MFESEEKTPWRCLLGKNGLKTLNNTYGISQIIPLVKQDLNIKRELHFLTSFKY